MISPSRFLSVRFPQLKLNPLGTSYRQFSRGIESHASVSGKAELEGDTVRPFEEIPEVPGFPVVGTLLDYTKIKQFDVRYIANHYIQRHKMYGDIYKENIAGNIKVFCRSPEATEVMFRSESRMPIREKVLGVERIRQLSDMDESLINISGERWSKLRSILNPLLLQNKMVWSYIEDQQAVSRDLAEFIKHNLDENGEVADFDGVLSRWSLEMSGTFILSSRLGLLKKDVEPEMQQLIDGIAKILEFIANSFSGLPLWKFLETKEVKETVAAQKDILIQLSGIVQDSLSKKKENQTIMEKIINSKTLDEKSKYDLLYDIMTAAVETTSKGAAFFIYGLTLSPEVQEKLRTEILQLPEQLTGRNVDNLVYLNAYMKEVMRLFPLSASFARTYDKDIVLSGYEVPAGISINNTSNATQTRNPLYFSDPDSCIPERWLGEESKKIEKFIYTGSFGIGPRACPGRRFALQEIRLLLIEILRNFRVEYHHKPIEAIFRATSASSEEPQFKFIPLDPK